MIFCMDAFTLSPAPPMRPSAPRALAAPPTRSRTRTGPPSSVVVSWIMDVRWKCSIWIVYSVLISTRQLNNTPVFRERASLEIQGLGEEGGRQQQDVVQA